MSRYEVVAHVIRELECDSAEEAAAIFRRQLLAEAQRADTLVHLAVWREDVKPIGSAISPALRRQLADFFAALERQAGEAEEAFRGRVAAILLASAADLGDADGGTRSGSPEPGRQAAATPIVTQ